MSEKPSVYLIQKCDTLENALKFFLEKKTAYCRTLAEKRTVFLSQMNFWEWEIDNLIYSFESFAERSEAWESVGVMSHNLERMSIKIKDGIVDDLWGKRYQRNMSPSRPVLDKDGDIAFQKNEAVKTVAPMERLQQVIETWNKLIDACEEVMVRNFPPNWNTAYITNLDKYRKKMP